MFIKNIQPFLASRGWRELAAMRSTHDGRPGSVFHHFGDEALSALLVEDLAGNNGIAVWIPLDSDRDNPRITEVQRFVKEHAG